MLGQASSSKRTVTITASFFIFTNNDTVSQVEDLNMVTTGSKPAEFHLNWHSMCSQDLSAPRTVYSDLEQTSNIVNKPNLGMV